MSDVCELGAARLDDETGALFVQCKGAPVSEDGTAPDFGETPMMCALGLTALPYQATEEGSAEGIVADDVPGMDGAVVAARDIRTAKVIGNGEGGDTFLHSTGPEQASQVMLKEKKRQAVLRTKDTRGKDMVVVLDGKNDKVQIAALGAIIEITRENGTVLTSETGGASIQLKGDLAIITGTVVLGGRKPVAPVHSGVGAGATSIPTPGVFIGV